MVRVGWKFQVFFLGPAAPGGAFPVERSGVTTASGTPKFDHRLHLALSCASMVASVAQKAACPTRLEIQPYSLQQAIVRFR